MKTKIFLAYIILPTLFSVAGLVRALNREAPSLEVLEVFIGSFFFYAAPYLAWLFIVAAFKTTNAVTHSGYISSTISLLLIASFWFFPPDPSGLPMQWMLYWPLAIILLLIIPGSTAVYIRNKAPNKAPQSTPQSGAPEL